MGEFFRALLDVIQYVWPFRIINQWEQGGFYMFGKFQHVVGPGCWPVIPWFTEIRDLSMVPALVSTPKKDITLSDTSTLHFAMTGWVQVTDFNLAVNTIDNYHQTTQELIEAVMCEKCADVDAARLQPDKRARLLADLTRWVNAESEVFGVTVTKLRFTTFVLNVKTIRLLTDTGIGVAGW